MVHGDLCTAGLQCAVEVVFDETILRGEREERGGYHGNLTKETREY
jgi:hypothetical protein